MPSEQLIKNFLSALFKEISLVREKFLKNKTISTIYVGGGTPSRLSPAQIATIFDWIFNSFEIESDAEITVELNPEDVNLELAITLHKIGVNRVSLGAQSAYNDELRFLGRPHSVRVSEKAYDILRKAGLDNINIDLIFGIPFGSLTKWAESLKWAANLSPEHISTYSLTVEAGTPLENLVKDFRIKLPSDDELREYFALRDEILANHGFERYEVSNYAKPGYESIHNLIYWTWNEYIGIGPSASSFLKIQGTPTRWTSLADLEAYINSLANNELPPRNLEVLTEQQALLEKVFLGLRLSRGIALPDESIAEKIAVEFAHLVERSGRSIRLTFDGVMVADTLSLEIALELQKLGLKPYEIRCNL